MAKFKLGDTIWFAPAPMTRQFGKIVEIQRNRNGKGTVYAVDPDPTECMYPTDWRHVPEKDAYPDEISLCMAEKQKQKRRHLEFMRKMKTADDMVQFLYDNMKPNPEMEKAVLDAASNLGIYLNRHKSSFLMFDEKIYNRPEEEGYLPAEIPSSKTERGGRTAYLAATNNDPHDQSILLFCLEVLTSNPNFNAEQAIRDAVAEYCQTTDGRVEVYRNNNTYNFGDAVNLPEEICKRHDFRIVSTKLFQDNCCFVNHDDNLAPQFI